MRDYVTLAVYAIAAIALVVAIGFYTYHVWSDCLGENSVLTCMRMLNK